MNATTMRILCAIAFIVLAPFIGGLIDGIDRKITARLQGRQGPPILQPFYDIIKLLKKQTVVVNSIQTLLVIGHLVFVIFTGVLFFSGADILLTFFALTLAEIYYVMASCASNSPYSTMGAQRELIQMVAYEPMILLIAIGFYMSSGSFFILDIMKNDLPAIVSMPGIFLGFLFILTIKLRKSPFDISTAHHAHQEMVKGTTVEFSGSVFAITELAHWYESVFLMGILMLFFLSSNWVFFMIGTVASVAAFFLEILIDNTFARMKWQFMFKSTWIISIILGMVNILILNYIK